MGLGARALCAPHGSAPGCRLSRTRRDQAARLYLLISRLQHVLYVEDDTERACFVYKQRLTDVFPIG